MKFELYEEELKKFAEWEIKQQKKIIENQKKSILKGDTLYDIYESCWESGFPYAGAIGGHFSFRFTRTSIGDIVIAIDNFTNEELDLTDYNSW